MLVKNRTRKQASLGAPRIMIEGNVNVFVQSHISTPARRVQIAGSGPCSCTNVLGSPVVRLARVCGGCRPGDISPGLEVLEDVSTRHELSRLALSYSLQRH